MWDNEADRNIFLEVLMCDKNQVELSPERQERIRYWSGHMEGNWGNEVKGLNDEVLKVFKKPMSGVEPLTF